MRRDVASRSSKGGQGLDNVAELAPDGRLSDRGRLLRGLRFEPTRNVASVARHPPPLVAHATEGLAYFAYVW